MTKKLLASFLWTQCIYDDAYSHLRLLCISQPLPVTGLLMHVFTGQMSFRTSTNSN